jgi:cell division protein FtsA
MYRIVIPPGSEIIHVMPQDYIVDYEEGIKDPVGMSGVKLEADFHIITAQTSAINNINKCIRRGGLEIEDLILEPLASSLAVLSEEEKEAGVCLIDIGGGTTDIAVFYDNIIRHTAVIPFGGNILTTDIQHGLQVMAKQAEQLKTRFGKAIAEEASPNEIVSIPGIRNRTAKEISVKNLSNIIQARMEEIIEMAHTEIINSGYENRLAGGIVITGGGAQLACLKQLVEYMTGMDTRIGYPNEHLGKSKMEAVKSPMYATAVGLVLSGFRSLDERDERYREAKESHKNTKVTKVKMNPTGDFFKDILKKTKGLLIDDLNDKNEY